MQLSARRRSRLDATALLAIVICGALALAAPAPAAAQDPPAQQSVTVIPPSGTTGPRPTGDVIFSVNGRRGLSAPLTSVTNPITTVTPMLGGAASLLGQQVTITYSGDSNYEASDGTTVTFPTNGVLKIVAKPKDTAAPTITIDSPGDGVRYQRGESVVAIYSCKDPDDRSTVTKCSGPVASSGPLDTSTEGTFSFAVQSQDALGNAATKSVTYAVAHPGTVAPPPPPPPVLPDSASPPASPAGAPAPSPGLAPAAIAVISSPGAPVKSKSKSSAAAPSASSASPGPAAKPAAVPKPAGQEYAPYDPRSEPAKAVGVLVATFALLQLGGVGGLALAGSARARSGGRRNKRGGNDGDRESSEPSPSMEYEGVDIEYLAAGIGAVAIGDRSRTWGWPGTRTIDRLGVAVPKRVAHRSPLLARLIADSTYLRAILGSGSLITMAAGISLGVLALRDTGGDAVPPVAGLAIAIAVLGVLDAAAGFTAVSTFMIGTLLLGGVDESSDVRLLLGLAALWCIVPVIAGALRPLRREPTRGVEESWDRLADFVIASLIGAWAVQKIVLSLPGLAGLQLPIADHANLAAYCVLGALMTRLGLETLAAHLYPRRLDITEAAELPEPDVSQRLFACALRTTAFVFFAYIVVGSSWQLWVGAALFAIPQVLGVFEDRFPNSPALYRVMPKGLVELVLMLFVGTAVGALLIRLMNENADTFLADTLVLLSLPGFLLSMVQLIGRDGDEPRIGWGKRIAGVGLIVLGVLLVLGRIF